MKKNLILGLLTVFSTCSLKAQEIFSSYEGPDSAALLNESGDDSALRQRLVRVDWDIPDSAYQSVSEGGDSELTLNFFPDESFFVVVNQIHQNLRPGVTHLTGTSLEGSFAYIPQNREEEDTVLTFHHPKEFAYYLVHKAGDGVYLITKHSWDSLFTPYRGYLTPDRFQTFGRRYNLVYVNHERIFSQLEDFSDGKETRILFGLFNIPLNLYANITSVEHNPVQDSPGDYEVTLDITGGRQATGALDNTFDLYIVDGKVISMEITYYWDTSPHRYRIAPFDTAENVYIVIQENRQ